MIRFIAAIDEKYGIADDRGIPWLGKLPTDSAQYHQKIRGFPVIMGFGHYKELKHPYPDSENYVATTSEEPLLPGFIAVPDAHQLLEDFQKDIWNIGGALLCESTMDLAGELYITRLERDFNCTKFFPQFETDFKRVETSAPQTENGIVFHFERWVRQ
jgi:dihydrofolate reductase